MDVLTGYNEMNIYKNNPVQAGLILLLIFFMASFFLISIYIDQERQRDLDGWQSKLSIMADVNEADLESYLLKQKLRIKKITNNSSLQLFMTENYLNSDKKDDVYLAQYGYIRNLVHSIAKEYGFDAEDMQSINTKNDQDINKGLV